MTSPIEDLVKSYPQISERDIKIISLYKKGPTAPKIGKELGIGPSTVYRVLEKYNINCSGIRNGSSKFSIEIEKEIIKEYQSGYNLVTIAQKYGASEKTISNILERYGIERKYNRLKLEIEPVKQEQKKGFCSDLKDKRNPLSLYKRWLVLINSGVVDDNWFDFSVFKQWALENGYKEGLLINKRNRNKPHSPTNSFYVIDESDYKINQPLYACWMALKGRNKGKVCNEWLNNYETFRNWSFNNGYEKGFRIYRKDKNKPYQPNNCYYRENSKERKTKLFKVIYKNSELTLEELSKHNDCEVGLKMLVQRINQGLTVEEAIKEKYVPENQKYTEQLVTAFGETKTAKEWGEDERNLVGYRKSVNRIFIHGIEPEIAMQYEDHLNYRKSKCSLSNKEVINRCKEFLQGEFIIIENFDEFMGVFGIYGIFNIISGKLYVGQAISKKGVCGRLGWHQLNLEYGIGINKHLQNSWNKRGEEAFAYILLEKLIDDSPEGATIRESYWVDKYDTTNPIYGYNMRKPETGRLGMVVNPLSTIEIKNWIKQWLDDHNCVPSTISGIVHYDEMKRTWRTIDNNLRQGHSGLPGGSSLKRLCYEILGKEYKEKTLPTGVLYDVVAKAYSSHIRINGQNKRIIRNKDEQKAILARQYAAELIESGINDITIIRTMVREKLKSQPIAADI